MPTSFPMSIPHSPTGFVNQASLDNAFTVPINDLAAAASLGEYGRATSGTTVTLATIGVDVAGDSSVTFTLASTRRVRIDVWAAYRLNTATGGRMTIMPAYNTGASVVLGSAVQIGINAADRQLHRHVRRQRAVQGVERLQRAAHRRHLHRVCGGAAAVGGNAGTSPRQLRDHRDRHGQLVTRTTGRRGADACIHPPRSTACTRR
jgi:hypothetical protein